MLIVVIAALAVLRTYAPAGMFRFGARAEIVTVWRRTPRHRWLRWLCLGIVLLLQVADQSLPCRRPATRAVPVQQSLIERPVPPAIQHPRHGTLDGKGASVSLNALGLPKFSFDPV